VQKGWALTYRKKAIPKPKELLKFGERWRPYRSVASWYMWRAVELAGPAARKITKATTKAARAKKIKKIVVRKKRIVIKKRSSA
jgi:DNA-3-methyladenine glycosylase II